MALDPVKIEVARRQLGTALALFLDDNDPVSVHCLACGGGEIADFLARTAGKKPFAQHALEVHPEMKPGELVRLRNQYWNAMKHAASRDGRVRDDAQLLASFDDANNDHTLFVGWYDFASAVGKLPIEAQVFQVWYFANFPEKLSEEYDAPDFANMFPDIRLKGRSKKKKMLRQMIAKAKGMKDVMGDPKTERRKLILGTAAEIL